MNINELITTNITIVVAVIIVLIIVSVIITFMLLKVTESKYNDLELQNVRLIEQVKTYTNNLAKLYEEEKIITEQESATQDIPAPDVNKINAMPEMAYQQPVQQPFVQPSADQPAQQVQPVQPAQQPFVQQPAVQQPVQTVQQIIPQIVETTTVQGQNIPPPQQQDVVTVDTTK